MRQSLLTTLKADYSDAVATNIERSVYNYCIAYADKQHIDANWDNLLFSYIYAQRSTEIIQALRNGLGDKVKNKEILGRDVGLIQHDAINPSIWQPLRIECHNEDGIFQCKKCKGRKTEYYSVQTRSADEPMTNFITCLNCGNRWKM